MGMHYRAMPDDPGLLEDMILTIGKLAITHFLCRYYNCCCRVRCSLWKPWKVLDFFGLKNKSPLKNVLENCEIWPRIHLEKSLKDIILREEKCPLENVLRNWNCWPCQDALKSFEKYSIARKHLEKSWGKESWHGLYEPCIRSLHLIIANQIAIIFC